ncbi:MAG TPA: hypothetical protein VG889_01655 [Rhizomicrobium sp.]|nr:hypothetical protein [Rhizomicrobium sp.]
MKISAALALACFAFAGSALADPTITLFDAPGRPKADGTVATAVNGAGDVTGYWITHTTRRIHGFIRMADGTFESFSIPPRTNETSPTAIDDSDTTIGNYRHGRTDIGFVRTQAGTVASIDFGKRVKNTGVSAEAIASDGTVTGWYLQNKRYHSFVRAPDGAITKFRAGPNSSSFDGTVAKAITPSGVIAGYYSSNDDVAHGFIRAADGKIKLFDAPGAGTRTGAGTFAAAMNASGAIAGATRDDNLAWHGFVRHTDGSIDMFDLNGAGADQNQGTKIVAINDAGAVTGYVVGSDFIGHGFVAASKDEVAYFDASGDMGARGTYPQGLNAAGEIAGYTIDLDHRMHGFVRTP